MPKISNIRTLERKSGSLGVPAFPMQYVKALGWQPGDEIEFKLNPGNGNLVVSNTSRKPKGWLATILSLQQFDYDMNPKEYRKKINANLSPEGRALLANPKIWSDLKKKEVKNRQTHKKVLKK